MMPLCCLLVLVALVFLVGAAFGVYLVRWYIMRQGFWRRLGIAWVILKGEKLKKKNGKRGWI